MGALGREWDSSGFDFMGVPSGFADYLAGIYRLGPTRPER